MAGNLLSEVHGMIQARQREAVFLALVTATNGTAIQIQRTGQASPDSQFYSVLSGAPPSVGSQVVCLQMGSGLVILSHTGHANDLGSGVDYQFLQTLSTIPNGNQWADGWATLDRPGYLNIVSTAAETTLYTFTVPGGALGSTRGLKLDMVGDYLNNSAATKSMRFRVKYGATTLWDSTTALLAVSANRAAWQMTVILGELISGTQQMGGWFGLSSQTLPTAGQGDINTAPLIPMRPIAGSSAIDSTVDQTFIVTLQHSGADVNTSLQREWAALTLV